MSIVSNNRKRPAFERFRKHLAFNKLHHDKAGAFVLADIVNRGDVRRAQRGGGSRFGEESFAAVGIILIGRGRNLSATWRPSLMSSARNTSPIPPAAESFAYRVVKYGSACHVKPRLNSQ